MQRIRLVPLILIALVTLAVLFGGYQAYQRFNVIDPLEAQLKAVHGVQDVQVQTGNPGRIRVELGPVKDLQMTYTELVHTVTQLMGGSETIVIVDNPDDTLRTAYENFVAPMVSEGIAKGNYMEMISSVEGKAQSLGITARVTMDEHNIYIQLANGSHYLYHVTPYTLRQGGEAS
jgi:hypothetical protein